MPHVLSVLLRDGRADLLGAVHLVLAAWVTAHVLLNKRDVPAAIGWTGLAWLSPLAGPVLYFLFGINRVERRASRLKPDARRRARTALSPEPADAAGEPPPHLRALSVVAERITGLRLTSGNEVTVLRGGDTAYPAMIAAIGQARRSVALAAYIFRADAAGAGFIEALRAASARGVETRVLLDGIGGGYLRSRTERELKAAGVTISRFMHDWLPWRMPFLNLRSHKKLLIVDGTAGFTGGMNIGVENMLGSHPPDPVEDVHFRIGGPVVRHLMRSFAEDWSFTTGETLAGDAWWPELAASGPVTARGINSGPDEDLGALETVLAAAIGEARHRLRIVTPYFLPSARLMSALALAALRGVHIDVILPERSDHFYFDWAVRAHLGFFEAPRIRVHLSPQPFDHSKLVTLDGEWCLVGSGNWDARSLRLNFEFTLECYDGAFVAALDRLIDEKLARALPLRPADLAARPKALKYRDAATRLLLPYL
jgi:cardiolipin synthase